MCTRTKGEIFFFLSKLAEERKLHFHCLCMAVVTCSNILSLKGSLKWEVAVCSAFLKLLPLPDFHIDSTPSTCSNSVIGM